MHWLTYALDVTHLFINIIHLSVADKFSKKERIILMYFLATLGGIRRFEICYGCSSRYGDTYAFPSIDTSFPVSMLLLEHRSIVDVVGHVLLLCYLIS